MGMSPRASMVVWVAATLALVALWCAQCAASSDASLFANAHSYTTTPKWLHNHHKENGDVGSSSATAHAGLTSADLNQVDAFRQLLLVSTLDLPSLRISHQVPSGPHLLIALNDQISAPCEHRNKRPQQPRTSATVATAAANVSSLQQHRGLLRRLLQSSDIVDQVPEQTPSGAPPPPVVLAPNRTYRVNPLNNFQYYESGWDFFASGYWASVGWTAVWAPVIAIAWVLFGVGILIFVLCVAMCCSSHWRELRSGRLKYTAKELRWPLVFIVLGLLVTLTGFGLMVAGAVQFRNSINGLTGFVVDEVERVAGVVYNVTGAVRVVIETPAVSKRLPAETQQKIFAALDKANAAANNTVNKVNSAEGDVNDLTRILNDILFVLACFGVFLVLLGTVFGLLRWVVASNTITVFIWVTILVLWILATVFLFTWTFTGDTTTAMGQVADKPTDLSAFNIIVPCIDPVAMGDASTFMRFVGAASIAVLNVTIANQTQLFQNLNVAGICSPFGGQPNFTYTPNSCDYAACPPDATTCPAGEINLSSLSQRFAQLDCSGSGANQAACKVVQALGATTVAAIATSESFVKGLQNTLQALESFVRCVYISYIAQTVSNYMYDMGTAAAYLWGGFLGIAVGSMIFSLALPIYVYRGVRCYDRLRPDEMEEGQDLQKDMSYPGYDPNDPNGGMPTDSSGQFSEGAAQYNSASGFTAGSDQQQQQSEQGSDREQGSYREQGSFRDSAAAGGGGGAAPPAASYDSGYDSSSGFYDKSDDGRAAGSGAPPDYGSSWSKR